MIITTLIVIAVKNMRNETGSGLMRFGHHSDISSKTNTSNTTVRRIRQFVEPDISSIKKFRRMRQMVEITSKDNRLKGQQVKFPSKFRRIFKILENKSKFTKTSQCACPPASHVSIIERRARLAIIITKNGTEHDLFLKGCNNIGD